MATSSPTNLLRAGGTCLLGLLTAGCHPVIELLKDLETHTEGSIPAGFTESAGLVYFTASHGLTGRELFVTDGTPGGIDIVVDVYPGANWGSPANITAASGGRIYFTAEDGTDGDPYTTSTSVFKTDGDSDSTVRLTTPISSFSGRPSVIGPIGTNGVLFTMDDGSTGSELWRTDGTVGTTGLVEDIHTSGSSSPDYFVRVGSDYFFAATDSSGDRELWKSDGTAAGTSRVADINATASSSPRDLAVMNGKVYFQARQASSIRGLFVSDGTSAGTQLVTDDGGASNFVPETFAAAGNQLFFLAYYSELWVSDGTEAGTDFVRFFTPDSEGVAPYGFTPIGSQLFFLVNDDVAGVQLWVSDGTSALQLDDGLEPGSDRTVAHGGYYYYVKGDALRRTNGSAPETVYSHSGFAPAGLSTALGEVYLRGTDVDTGSELWKSDGTPGGTSRVADLNTATKGSNPADYVKAGAYTFFVATVHDTGRELYRTDGTETGTVLVKDINPGVADSSPAGLTEHNGILYFRADDGTSGVELWRSDGTEVGTYRVRDINGGTASSTPGDLYSGPSYLFFYASDGSTGNELWRSDGTEGGTVLVKDIYAGASSSTPRYFATAGTKVCFAATTSSEGRELWCSDGTPSGTTLVQDIRAGTSSSGINEAPILVGGYLYFGANDGVNGDELWRTDGSSANLVHDLRGGSGSSSPTRFAAFNGAVFFVAYDGARWEMWRSDGTSATMITGAIYPASYSNPGSLTVAGTKLFFTARDATTGYELYYTEGTAGTVQRVIDLNPGTANASINYMTALGDTVLFRATDGSHGTDLWMSDGTAAGTRSVSDPVDDDQSTYPLELAAIDGTLYVTLQVLYAGSEPHTFTP